jgi:hypothetical protein
MSTVDGRPPPASLRLRSRCELVEPPPHQLGDGHQQRSGSRWRVRDWPLATQTSTDPDAMVDADRASR